MTAWLFNATVFELFVGGGGRLFEIGPVTLRMLLFAICLCASVLMAWTERHRGHGLMLSLALVACYLLVQVVPFVGGFVRGASTPDIFTDFQPSLYWLMAPFFALVLNDPKMVERSAWLVKATAVTMSIAYLMVIGGLATGRLDFLQVYTLLDRHGEFVFRGEGFFFYKGFLFLAVSVLFFTATRGRWHSALLGLVLIALILTLTRGFVLATSVAAVLMLAELRRWRALGVALGLTVLSAFMVWVYLPSLDDWLMSAREGSNAIRSDDIRYMIDHASASTLLLGEGFGSYINGRLNIENSFLWILWKEGLPGLFFWLIPPLLCAVYFRRIGRHSPRHGMACAMFYSVILIYVQTATNPYLNNPIGLSFVLIALFSLRTLARAETGSPAPARLATAMPASSGRPPSPALGAN